jgi:hypothetical protein
MLPADKLLCTGSHLCCSSGHVLRPAANLLCSAADLLCPDPVMRRPGDQWWRRTTAAGRCSRTGSCAGCLTTHSSRPASISVHRAFAAIVGEGPDRFLVLSRMRNSSNEARSALFSNFSRRDLPPLLGNPVPEPSPESLARHSACRRSILTHGD